MSRDSLPRSVEIEQAQLQGFARSVVEVEWLLLILVLLYLFVASPNLAADVLMLATLVTFAGLVLVFRYAKPLAGRPRLKLCVEVALMIAFVTGVVVLAGAASSALVNLYLLPIVTAALALGRRATVLVVLLVAMSYLGSAALEAQGLTPAVATGAFTVLAPFVLVALLTTRLAESINTATERIRALSDRDELTGLYNMRAFKRVAEREHELASRGGGSYSVLMVDLDGLKAINDTFGHEAGNRAIKLVGDALLRITRKTDVAARFGGDEFIVLLPGANAEAAEEIAQRIRNVVFSTTLEVDVKIVRVKVSVGVGTFPRDGIALQTVMTAADRAMYKDKELREPPKGKLIFRRR
ncbi:MAG TPA: GGDEF domain-containing protein [Gammaproteobacteria bacterium]